MSEPNAEVRILPHEYQPGLYNACTRCGQTKGSPVHAAPDVAQLRDDNARLADEVEKRRRAESELRHKLEAAQKIRTPKHVHRYPWPSPDELPGPCAELINGEPCGKPFPRADDEGQDVEPELTPWDELMVAVRAELADWNPGEDS